MIYIVINQQFIRTIPHEFKQLLDTPLVIRDPVFHSDKHPNSTKTHPHSCPLRKYTDSACGYLSQQRHPLTLIIQWMKKKIQGKKIPIQPKIIFLSSTTPQGRSKISPLRTDLKNYPPLTSRPPVDIQILTGHPLFPIVPGPNPEHGSRGHNCQALNMSQGTIKGEKKRCF